MRVSVETQTGTDISAQTASQVCRCCKKAMTEAAVVPVTQMASQPPPTGTLRPTKNDKNSRQGSSIEGETSSRVQKMDTDTQGNDAPKTSAEDMEVIDSCPSTSSVVKHMHIDTEPEKAQWQLPKGKHKAKITPP